MTETVDVELPANAWAAISTGEGNVTAQLAHSGSARVYVGTVAPGAVEGLTVGSGDTLSLSDLSGSVWLKSLGKANVARVIRG